MGHRGYVYMGVKLIVLHHHTTRSAVLLWSRLARGSTVQGECCCCCCDVVVNARCCAVAARSITRCHGCDHRCSGDAWTIYNNEDFWDKAANSLGECHCVYTVCVCVRERERECVCVCVRASGTCNLQIECLTHKMTALKCASLPRFSVTLLMIHHVHVIHRPNTSILCSLTTALVHRGVDFRLMVAMIQRWSAINTVLLVQQ